MMFCTFKTLKPKQITLTFAFSREIHMLMDIYVQHKHIYNTFVYSWIYISVSVEYIIYSGPVLNSNLISSTLYTLSLSRSLQLVTEIYLPISGRVKYS